MAKDPAFLFYSNDFLSGIADLTMEERGQYITMLCLQHQKGHLSNKTIRLTVGSVSVDVLRKFKKDEAGSFFNERLELEINNRINFLESRRLNGNKGGRPKASGKPTNNHMPNLPEDENEDVIESTDVVEKFIVPEMQIIFQKHVPTYKKNRERDYKPLLSIAKFLAEHGVLNGSVEQNKGAILAAWDPLCSVIAKDKFYSQKSLSVISNQIQEITQIALHGKSNGKPDYGSKERADEYDRLFAERYPSG